MPRYTVSLSIDVEADNLILAALTFQDLINGLNPGWTVQVTTPEGKTEEVTIED